MAIYPIPYSKALTLREIASHWVKEMEPRSSETDILTEMTGDWWRGKLHDLHGTSRLQMLKFLKRHPEGDIVFRLPDEDSSLTVVDLSDGGALVDIGTEVPIPDPDPERWGEAACEAAFQVMAENYDFRTFNVTAPMLAEMVLSESQFSSWLSRRGTPRPNFWQQPPRVDRRKRGKEAWPVEKMREWIQKRDYSNQKEARKAFLEETDAEGQSAAFEAVWNEVHQRRPGKPRKRV